MKLINEDISHSIWMDKYRHGDERTILESKARVCRGVYINDSKDHKDEAFSAMAENLWCPGGRIHAGAGTDKRVTLINCYVNKTVPDSMVGIMDALNVAALTQQQGGGIGTDFSTIRPAGAVVQSSGSVSTGVLPFMDMFHAMCSTVKSSGSRRGAMMGTLAIWHPDVIDFITAKREKGRLTNFNVSVLVTDAFMKAVERDEIWELGFNVPPKGACEAWNIGTNAGKSNPTHSEYWHHLTGQKPSVWYIYKALLARELWEMILRNTYDWAEPGVIFIDRINSENNLGYCEYIHSTNPCGEQPLPPNGDCNLGAVNLAKMVNDPFTSCSKFNYDLLTSVTKIGMRFLDNVLDVSLFPTPEQKEEAMAKRRTGIGIMGLANALQMTLRRYGSDLAAIFTCEVMRTQRDAAYWASVELAKERGPFPLFDRDKYLARPYIKRLPEELRQAIFEHGIRNGVIQTIAPTGTTSIYYENVSSGIEPTFMWKHYRKVLQPDNSFAEFEVEDYGYKKYREYRFSNGDKQALDMDLANGHLPPYMVTALELTVDEHLNMQAAAQEFVDSSISKTINCPKDLPYEEFKSVYTKAYALGLKGVTTYRPSDVRGSVLSVESQATEAKGLASGGALSKSETKTLVSEPMARPEKLIGATYKVRWPKISEAFYVTINDFIDDAGVRRPFEIFINSKSVQHGEWIAALTRAISAIFRRGLDGGDITFIVDELIQVHSASGGTFLPGKKYVPSLVALIGLTIKDHLIGIGLMKANGAETYPEGSADGSKPDVWLMGEICGACNQPTLFMQEGCSKCLSCGYSSC